MTALVEGTDLARVYRLARTTPFAARPQLRAVDGVSLSVARGRSFGVVGESGSGKSTLARLVMALERPDSGSVRFDGNDLFALSPEALRKQRRGFQMVFQDPYGSLDPRQPVRRIVAEPLDVAEPGLGTAERTERVREMLDAVGLPANAIERYPHEFSGGQRQRIAIARALITHPALIVADEAVSALDVSVQAQVLNLLLELEETRGVTYLFIGHTLAVVEHVTAEVAVMYRGRFVETGGAREVFERPAHPYTQALVAAIPDPLAPGRRPHLALRDGEARAPNSGAWAGCAFAARCPRAEARCRTETPALRDVGAGRRAACHFA